LKLKNLDSLTTKLIFLFCLLSVGLNTVSLIFPALLVRISSNFKPSQINPLEFGSLAEYVIAVNVIVISIIFLYKRNSIINQKFDKIIVFLRKFDFSNKLTLIIVLSIGVIYVLITIPELSISEPWIDHYDIVIPRVENFSFLEPTTRYVETLLYVTSITIFDNIRVVPFLSSILLIGLVFLFTRSISQKNISGVISIIILLQSFVFYKFDTSATYPTFWISFYLLSLFLVTKKFHLSVLAYIASIFTKLISIFFIPFSIFYILESNLSKKKKATEILIYILFMITGTMLLIYISPALTQTYFSFDRFVQGFSIISLELRFDYFVLIFLLPLVIGLYYLSKSKIRYASSIMLLLTSSLLLQSFTAAVGLDILPYRYLPTIVFFSIGLGMIFSKNLTKGDDKFPKMS